MHAETAPSFGERRGHRLAPLNTNVGNDAAAAKSNIRLQRPRPTDYPSTNGLEGPVPLQSPVRRQTSKSSLRNLFSREKSSRAAVAPDTKLTEIEEAQTQLPQQTVAVPMTEDLLSPALTTPHTVPTTPTTITSPTTPRARATLKTARPRPAETDPTPSKEQIGWKPPPLFQAYPQSLKHESLSAPAMSADSILRLHATTGKTSIDDPRNQMGQDDAKKREQKERKHLRTLSGTINKVEWTQKIYVLATTGFILQYAGEGKHDRLPEKMLQLGPKSVAFASDAIPGKHWVVQVSQNSAAESAPDAKEPPKPKFASRFGFHRSHARRLARSFLLVFDNPDSMISWLIAIRAEVESRGGPKFTTEKHSDDDEVPHQLRNKSSIRQLVKKDPRRISSLFLQPQAQAQAQALQTPDEDDDGRSVGGMTWQSRRSSYVSVSRRSMIDSRAGSTSTGITENTPPVNGYDNSSSFSSVNVPVSPPVGTAVLDDLQRSEPEPVYARSPPSSSYEKRQSQYGSPRAQPIPAQTRTEPPQSNQIQSTIPEHIVRCASPPAPNFSVPSFSKKFASRQSIHPNSSSQASSPPPNVPGTLRRGESTGDFSIYSASPPPQSPTYSVASSRQTDSSDPSFITGAGTNTRRALRPSNSEDALSRIIHSAHGGNAFARLARPLGTPDTSPPSRPLSLVGRSGLGIHTTNESSQTIQNLPPLEPTLRVRVSTAHTDYQNAQNMSRRKSMPGLTLGPPAAPPPNCPLPKIPSPIAAQALPPWATSPPAHAPAPAQVPVDRFYGTQKVREHVQDRRKSHLPGAAASPSLAQQSVSRTAARQSRMI
ncbi:hypothetical protein N7478_007157 [Penicillium angulare]|uniref:uncharacterized protein n=1 Tax=Penicillium angulare TaxID=116970 RepID=UPI0025407244|nr:uncharacterized protein N7478_007157 [Penicillium angulare]KAJ5281785.1 hypothetical protein N7478_007157 [Penicillium angulare]